MRTSFLSISLVTIALTAAACGGFVTPPPKFTPAVVQGQYEIVAASNVTPGGVALIELNFTQTGVQVFAGSSSVLVIQGTQQPSSVFTPNSLGAECDNGIAGNDSVQGTFSSATQLSYTLTETGVLGTGTSSGNVTVSPDGQQITSGTYTVPAQCGFGADNGTLTGAAFKPFSGRYAGTLSTASGTHTEIVIVTQNALNLTVSGTDNGTAFTLTGTVTGATFDVSGSIAGTPVRYIGRYLPVSDTFLVYDGALTRLGNLSGGT
jgi:hypothetical protein